MDVKKMIAELIHRQTVDHSNVVPHQRYVSGKFFLVSCAGMITYKCKTEKDVSRFRDKWISRFEEIKTLKFEDQKREFFRLFKEIRKEEKIKLNANARTRLWYSNPFL